MKIYLKIFIILILIFILIFLIKLFFLKQFFQIQKIEDYTFFKFFSERISKQNKIEKSNEYEFNVKYNKTNFKSIDLLTTIKNEKILYEKIAPGTNGEFNIILNSNKNLKYKIVFKSINEKPQNLNFIALKEDNILAKANDLDELSQHLKGNISKNECLNIKIYWYWNYENKENSELTDMQDTEDAKKIQKYQFNIYALGEEIN